MTEYSTTKIMTFAQDFPPKLVYILNKFGLGLGFGVLF